MTPICPACRAALFLDSYACWRCGLSVRPTCSRCGEPLMHGMDACWFCLEPVTEPDDVHGGRVAAPVVAAPRSAPASAPAVEPVTVSPTVTAIVDAPPRYEPPPRPAVHHVEPVAYAARVGRPVRSPNRIRRGRVLVRALLLGVLVAAGAAAYEGWSTRNVPPDAAAVRFSSITLDGVGAISYPDGWKVEKAKRQVAFLSGDGNGELSLRGFRITQTAVPLDEVDDYLTEQEDGFRTHEPLSTERSTVDGRKAIRHVFLGNDLRFEQWWVTRDKRGTIRIDLWSRPADDIAPAVDARIVDSLDVR